MVENCCPVRRVIDEYYGSSESARAHDDWAVKVGGDDCLHVCDGVSYYINLRKMEIARFKLTRPGPGQISTSKLFREGTYAQLYHNIIDVAVGPYMVIQFEKVVTMIEKMEELIMYKVDDLARAGKNINIQLPTLILPANVSQIIKYRPDVLYSAVNKIIEYMNNIDISSIVNIRPEKISPISPMKSWALNMENVLPARAPTIEALDDYLAHEILVAQYAAEVEKYQCYVTNQLNHVIEACQIIISQLFES